MHAAGLTRSAFVNFSPSRGSGDYFALTLNLFVEPIYFCPYFSEFRVMSQYIHWSVLYLTFWGY